jgi:lysosomal alpha-mannosidase
MVTFGCDFAYMNANVNFKNMDKLMKYINANKETYGLNVKYSTPIEYVRAVHAFSEREKVSFELKTDDFFPYADNRASFWTGYFTSRPALKGYVRSRANVLHSSMRAFTAARATLNKIDSVPDAGAMARLDRLWEAFSVAQHHDAVAGTEKQPVAYDYAERLSLGTSDVHQVLASHLGDVAAHTHKAAAKFAAATKRAPPPGLSFCEYLNVSVCDPLALALKAGQTVPVMLYNGLARERNEYVRLPVPASVPNVRVLGPDGKAVPAQIFADPSGFVKDVNTVVFAAVGVPPMGFTTYFVEPLPSSSRSDPSGAEWAVVSRGFAKPGVKVSSSVPADGGSIENDFYSVSVDASTGRWSQVTNKKVGQSLRVLQDYQWYNASCGACCRNKYHQASGAYIFRPNRTETFAVNSGAVKTTFIKGSLVEEAHAVWADWVWSSARLYKGQNFVEVTAKIGEIPIADKLGKEVVVRYSTPLETAKTWFTDSEGQEMQTRVRNYRPTWNYTVTQPVSGNYYPMNTGAFIRGSGNGSGGAGEQNMQLTLVTDRSKGCTSMKDGQLENMHHRRLLWDDHRGVGEPLNETEAIVTTQFLTVNTLGGPSNVQMRELQLRINNPLIAMFGTADSATDYLAKYAPTWKPLKGSLPANVHLVSLHTQENGMILIRLNHIFGVGEDTEMCKPATVDLRSILADIVVVSAEELALTANQPRSEVQNRMQWSVIGGERADESVKRERAPSSARLSEFVIELKPMEIRTFMLQVQQGQQ